MHFHWSDGFSWVLFNFLQGDVQGNSGHGAGFNCFNLIKKTGGLDVVMNNLSEEIREFVLNTFPMDRKKCRL